MKNLAILSTALFAVSSLAAHAEEPAPPATAAPARSTAQVSLRVDAKNIRAEKEKKKPDEKKDQPKSETTTKSLDIQISAAKTINGPLKLVTSWYGRDLSSREEVIAEKEETEVPLDATKTAKVSSKPCSFTSTPAGKKKGADGKMEKVDASGQTYVGWVIRAYDGTTLVGEASSAPPLLKRPY